MDNYQATFEAYDKLAAAYQDKFMDLDLYNDTYDSFCQLLDKPQATIFEIGCGPGNITKYLLAKRPDFKIEAIDIAPNMIELAQRNNPTAKFEVLDARHIGNLNRRYDGIMIGFCMPYLSKQDCAKLIKDCNGLLQTGGILYFSCIEGDYEKSNVETSSDGKHRIMVYYYEAEYLLSTLFSNEFELIELFRKPYQKSNGTIDTHLIFIAKKMDA